MAFGLSFANPIYPTTILSSYEMALFSRTPLGVALFQLVKIQFVVRQDKKQARVVL